MSRSATCSELHIGRSSLAGALWLAATLGAPVEADSQVLLTQEQALAIAFPEPAAVERRTAFLSEEELADVNRLAEPAGRSRRSVVTYYVGFDGERPMGAAYFDAHRVRTMQEVLMVVVSPDGLVSQIEVLGFAEPPEYMAPDGWIELFTGRGLDERTSTRGDIPLITGATLTAHSTSGAVRRSLALHEVIRPFAAAEAPSEAGSQ